VDNSYPTPALCDTLTWPELRILVDRLYRDMENHRTLVAALRADLAAVREARDGWPGEGQEYSVRPVCDDCGKPGELVTTPSGVRVCRDCYMGENWQEQCG
jgi:hypothetical protein